MFDKIWKEFSNLFRYLLLLYIFFCLKMSNLITKFTTDNTTQDLARVLPHYCCLDSPMSPFYQLLI